MATRSLNQVQLIGNLTRDAELRYTSGGTSISTFTVATNRNYTDSSGNNVEDAEFTQVVAWAKLAEICAQLLKKGMKVYIKGRLSTSEWDDQNTGAKMRRTEVVADDMIILSSGSGGGDNSNYSSNNNSNNNSSNDSKSDQYDQDVDLKELEGFEEQKESSDSDSSSSEEDSNQTPF